MELDLIKLYLFFSVKCKSVLKCLSCLSVFKTVNHPANRIETTSLTTSNVKLKLEGKKAFTY